ncbi:MAG: TIGR00375 family protein [Candidatus Altiarchaeota archaeon]
MMDLFNVDFHIHSRYSGGVSDEMTLPVIAGQAVLKGLDVVATGDALHPKWLGHMKEILSEEDGLYCAKGFNTRFIVQTEVEDVRRVHHVIILPSISAAESLAESLASHSPNISSDGRPNVRLTGEEIVDYAREVGGLVGPSHAFTPWTAVYKEYDSLPECYGGNMKHIHFMELGLSADSQMADRIEELQGLTFMANSDCHSPWPHRLGREFNRLGLRGLSFTEIRKAIIREGGRSFALNAGLDPREGKYHVTACSRCYLKFRDKDVVELKRRCPECGGIIKKGVESRIGELAAWDKPRHPGHRPPYMHVVPLAEVVSLAVGVKNLQAKKVKAEWDRIVGALGSEINVLVDADLADVRKVNPKVAEIIGLFRSGRMKYVAGGGGNYGRPTLTGEKDVFWDGGQRKLCDY